MIEERIRRLGAEAGIALPRVRVTGDDPVLPSVFRVGTAAAVAVGAAAATAAALSPGAAGGPMGAYEASADAAASGAGATVDVREAAVAFRDERHFRIDGAAGELWAPLSDDYRTADGWVRLHCNFDHHRDAALAGLGLGVGAGKADVVRACAERTAVGVEEAVTAAGGCAAAMRSRAEWLRHPHAAAVAASPLVDLARIGDAVAVGHGGGRRPLEGVRVLDLTRVIAGPVATRTLAAYGARVLRVGAEHLPEIPGAVVGTAFGKRSCHLDLRTPAGRRALRDLVAEADVFVQSYRPGALTALGFGPGRLAAIRPGIVCVDISAYGTRGPWSGRRGFDSLVQMACGIVHEGGAGTRPRPLPAQVLDHATGYLAAFGAMAALLRRSAEGGSWWVRLSLARTALWLDGLGRVNGENTAEPEVADLLAEMDSPFGRLTYVRPPGSAAGVPPHWSSPPPRQGEHPPAWW
ncbi:crotonobetainyl-CoA:carnitine CoA-transferase CaiB-like acyl-CoA transferase [Streptosporangium becharense]|uniref:Crotonobetainyl-CoA:carnitine CoA-transferase CaiB-like acyl-CoA transferase n=1 Tax=Streptosporangium becharense TaxID=1816182 RepID=A0A7W9IF55_9ACTN|nr:CoA transferase [Streptosporangium becharense]MBB2910066.1 crotonobetainyl-CoA:carnitine CoA-transferase CaiB-like acyl-CoA transferase [Streptosporangium becharense]MBB5818979.1 crotonobetainyl-CoA:carnitine CoA-transferase CaiB-like acyl-CoA transferase [Streptosporangium becharense]